MKTTKSINRILNDKILNVLNDRKELMTHTRIALDSWFTKFKKKHIAVAVYKTKPLAGNRNSDTEIHTVLCHRDLFMYIIAIKSFLRFYNNVKVVVHNDGSLTNSDKEILHAHITDINIIERDFADSFIEKKYYNSDLILQFRKLKPHFFEVIDYFIFCESKKIICLDADILFLHYPSEIVGWIESDSTGKVLFNYEETAYCALLSDNGHPVENKDFPFSLIKGFNNGLCCVYKEVADFNILNRYLQFIADNYGYRKNTYVQPILGVYILNSKYKEEALNIRQYKILADFIFEPEKFRSGSIFKHYNVNTFRFANSFGYFKDMRKVISELK